MTNSQPDGMLYDPPGGWRYGFPKPYLPLADETLADTLLRDGYPQHEIDNCGATHCRFIGEGAREVAARLDAVVAAPANDNTARNVVEETGLQSLISLPGYAYLGSPYSKFAGGLDAACAEVSIVAAKLMRRGLRIFSPIAHSHTVGTTGELDNLDWSFWQAQDQPLIDAASSLIVLMMDGWQDSVGLAYEIECFVLAHKPIVYISPEEV